MASLAEMRAKLAQMEPKSSDKKATSQDNALYPFWNIDDNETATIRFLKDKDPTNTFFWVPREMIRLTFPGVKGGDEHKPVTVQVPCMEMWPGEVCPVHTEIRPWFQDPSLEEKARSYWKKRSYIFQGLVTDNPLKEDSPENPIRRFVIGPQIFNLIKRAIMDPDMENSPTDALAGTDFKLTKTSKGKYADYTSSNWARRESSLNDEQLAAIDTYGLNDLKDFLPAKPTPEGVRAIAEMFEASVDGELYDVEKWGDFYRPWGVDKPNNSSSTTTAASTTAKETTAVRSETGTIVDNSSDIPFEDDVKIAEAAIAPKGNEDKHAAILQMIKNRS